MAAEIIDCPDCRRRLRVPEGLLGRLVQCPTCGKTFTAEIAGSVPPPAQVPVEERPPWEPGDPAPLPVRSRRAEEPEGSGPHELSDSEDPDEQDEPRLRGRRRRRHLAPHRGSTVMALGIIGLCIAPLILGPIAWIMGNSDLREMREGRMDPAGRSDTNTGRICGMIATIVWGGLLGLFLLFYCVLCGCFGGIMSLGGAAGR